MANLFLRSQSELLADLQARMNDTAARWSAAQYTAGINDCLASWQGAVVLEQYYALPAGWVQGVYVYDLPGTVREPVQPQALDGEIWTPLGGRVERSGNSLSLHLRSNPPSVPGRVRYPMSNSRIPTAVPKLKTTVDGDDTTLVVIGILAVDDAGFVKVDAEWMAYNGIAYGSDTTLQNVARGLWGTTAAGHTGGSADVAWGVAADHLLLYDQLAAHVQMFLHSLMLADGATHERNPHEKMMAFWQQRAEQLWQRYQPQRASPRILPPKHEGVW